MATDAVAVFKAIRLLVAAVPEMGDVNSDRKTAAPHAGNKFNASVLYNGDDLSEFVMNQSGQRIDHQMPVAIQVRTGSKDDDKLVGKLYEVLDAVLDCDNKPDDVTRISPVSIDVPEGVEYLTAFVNVLVEFRGA